MKKTGYIIVFIFLMIFCFDEGYALSSSEEQKKNMGSCMGYTHEKSCEYNSYYSCIWNETKYGDFCNTDELLYVECGDAFDIPYQAPSIIAFAVNLLKIATPIVLIIVSVISLLKALASSKEDELKKAKSALIRKLIAAALVFFVISIVQFVILKVADVSEKNNISDCLSCFLNNDCEDSVYYKNNVGGDFKCKYLKSGKLTDCKGNE